MSKETQKAIPPRAIAVVGPTASGKTALAIELARRLSGEIISCDSMQVYQDMDIGTAKATQEERAQIPHHLIDFLPPNTPYSAADYGEDAYKIACALAEKDALPIFCGGTGLYLNAAVRALHHTTPPPDPLIRARLQALSQTENGRTELFERLCMLDPREAQKTHKNNTRRVIRALEIYELTGMTKSRFDEESASVPPRIEMLPILLDFHSRQLLYERIEKRVDLMMQDGLENEARRLYARGFLAPDTTAGQAIGYKELAAWLDGHMTEDEAVAALKTATRHYAKRQLTWFRALDGVLSISPDLPNGCIKTPAALADELMPAIHAFLNKKQ